MLLDSEIRYHSDIGLSTMCVCEPRVFQLLDRGADERQGIGGSGGAATECGGDVGHLFHSQETDDQIAQSGHHLRG